MRVKTHVFDNVKYEIDLDKIVGLCDNPIKKRRMKNYPVVRVTMGLPYNNDKGAKLGLITLIHESLHASDWNMSEKKVGRISTDIGNLIWRLGYRREMGK